MKKAAFITSIILLFIILCYKVSGLQLSYEKPIKSPYVLLEGWISHPVLENAAKYIVENNIDSVFIVGFKDINTTKGIQIIDKTIKFKKKWNTEYALDWGGILGFEIPAEKLEESFIVKIKMHGAGYANFFPHYRIFFNNCLINGGFVNEKDSVYSFKVSKKAIDSLACLIIDFDNDMLDRTLYVSDIYIDTMNMDSLMLNSFFITYAENPDIKYVSKMTEIKYYIGDCGYDTSRVKFIEVNDHSFTKTLALAKAAKGYFSKNEVKNINIITTKIHSGRSYLNFNNCLEKNIQVGCIPVSTFIDNETSFIADIDERVSLLLSWIYWFFH